jgi:hypothetical protein
MVLEEYYTNNARKHNLFGPARHDYVRNKKTYNVNNIDVPEYVIEKPESITLDSIFNESNIEVRRVMWERADKTKIFNVKTDPRISILDSRDPNNPTKVVDLFQVAGLRIPANVTEDYVAMLMTNSTPEPDGSHKKYLLRVPPTMRTVAEAMAWSYNTSNYAPVIET